MTEQNEAPVTGARHPYHTDTPSPDDVFEVEWTLEITERWTRRFTRAELEGLGVDFPPEAGDMGEFASEELPGFEDTTDAAVEMSADVDERYITGVRRVQGD
jgi:hypothetical protein